MTKLHLLTAAALLSLTACGGAKDKAAANRQGGANSTSANAAAPAGDEGAAAGDHHDEGGPRVLLTGQGLETDGAAPAKLAFGAARGATLAMVTPIWGEPGKVEDVEECGGSGPAQMADFGAVVLFFQNDKLIGWEQREASETPWIGTPGGASVGVRRPQLKDSLGGEPKVEQTSLGTEFSRDGVSGVLANDGADAQVDRLWAGNSCAMR